MRSVLFPSFKLPFTNTCWSSFWSIKFSNENSDPSEINFPLGRMFQLAGPANRFPVPNSKV